MSHDINLDLIPEPARAQVVKLIQAFDATQRRVCILSEELRLARIKKYGPKSETLSDAQLQLLELEPCVEAGEVQAEAARGSDGINTPPPPPPAKPSGSKNPSTKPHGREPLPAHLERQITIVPLPPNDCVCPKCSGPKDLIGYEESEQLHVIPARYVVQVTRREKRACGKCSEMGVQTAPAPERILPKGKLSDDFLIEVLIRKFGEHMPVYRQSAVLLRDAGVQISRQTLTDGLMACGELMRSLSGAMKSELLTGNYIQADETTVPVQSAAVRGRNHRGYLWQYSHPRGSVVFDFQMGRSREGPKEFLNGFEGWLQCDGYGAYDKLGEGIRFAGCLAHARRGFFEASQLSPSAPEPLAVLEIFTQIYAVEAEAREKPLSWADRHQLRQVRSRPLMEKLRERVVEIQKTALPASQLGKACGYLINQWERLIQFLEDGQLEADNNWCENGMRPIALGRRNWLHIGDEKAGPKIAAIASVIETCKRHKINLREYLADVLPRLGSWPAKRVGELTPLAWKAARAAAATDPKS